MNLPNSNDKYFIRLRESDNRRILRLCYDVIYHLDILDMISVVCYPQQQQNLHLSGYQD